MKIINILLTLFILTTYSVSAQKEAEEDELYPDQYTFEKADDFLIKGENKKAIWFYINLFPNNKTQVIERVKALEAKLDSENMGQLIKMSFALYVMYDPEVNTFNNGVPKMDMDRMKIKGAWGDELIQKISDPNNALTSAAEYNFRGLDKANLGDFNGAIKDFDKAIDIKPTGQIYFNRAYSRSMVKDYSGSIQDYDKAIALEYRLALAYFERGYCKFQINELAEAIEDYTKAIKVDKDYADAYNNRALTKFIQKDYKGAIKDFDKSIKIKPEFAGSYVNRGFVKKQLGDEIGACKDWNEALKLGFSQAQQIINENCK